MRSRRAWARDAAQPHRSSSICALGPVLALFGLIRIWPILETIRLSFYNYHITQRRNPFIGLANYIHLLNDDPFRDALLNTIAFSVLARHLHPA